MSVSGEGRAINITYVDSGRVMQTEFNACLWWDLRNGQDYGKVEKNRSVWEKPMIIAGKKPWIQKVEKDPLMRAFRLDKMTLAVLECLK